MSTTPHGHKKNCLWNDLKMELQSIECFLEKLYSTSWKNSWYDNLKVTRPHLVWSIHRFHFCNRQLGLNGSNFASRPPRDIFQYTKKVLSSSLKNWNISELQIVSWISKHILSVKGMVSKSIGGDIERRQLEYLGFPDLGRFKTYFCLSIKFFHI